MNRCVNIDWLEVHCLEDNTRYPCNADFFVHEGWQVRVREYGTRIYNEMFTLLDNHDEPFLEIRRSPKSDSNISGILDPLSCHIRLTNRYCYMKNCVTILRDFLARYGYTFRRIFRIDICNDFERFDLGDDPQKFITRYLRHKFAKINQCRRTAHGDDRWDGCIDNSLKWGQPKSMVSTKLYNKTMELGTPPKKEYIVASWFANGLITNPLTMEKVRKDGTTYKPTIWRVEFSVQSGAAGWAIIEDCNGAKNKLKPIANTLSCYDTDAKLLQMFASLAHHYFHFKVYEANKRKDRCKDKVLFRFDFDNDKIYHLERHPGSSKPSTDDERLRRLLEQFAAKHCDPNVVKACNIILENLSARLVRNLSGVDFNAEAIRELQMILARRLTLPEEDFQVCVETVRRILAETKDSLF